MKRVWLGRLIWCGFRTMLQVLKGSTPYLYCSCMLGYTYCNTQSKMVATFEDYVGDFQSRSHRNPLSDIRCCVAAILLYTQLLALVLLSLVGRAFGPNISLIVCRGKE